LSKKNTLLASKKQKIFFQQQHKNKKSFLANQMQISNLNLKFLQISETLKLKEIFYLREKSYGNFF